MKSLESTVYSQKLRIKVLLSDISRELERC
jgi:hypothetical protein